MKVVAISKCEECPKWDCPLRKLCGLIPKECPLSDMLVCSRCGIIYRKKANAMNVCQACLGGLSERDK